MKLSKQRYGMSMQKQGIRAEAKTGGSGRAELLPTGVEGFDAILGGGLPAHHVYLIQGLAGSGKTTLACQIGFAQARLGKKVLILTLIAESHAKLLQHLRNFSFFDDRFVGQNIVFYSGYTSLAEGGLRDLINFITESLNDQRPEIMIIDGFRTVRETKESELSLSEFMHSLNTLVSTMGCTTFLLSPIEGNLPESENTLVDGLVELSQFHDGVRTIRELKVLKVRGGDHLLGKHAFEVCGEGIVVYPRLEAVATRTNRPADSSNSIVGFGIPSLEQLTNGGVMKGSTTNLVGSPGAGKTLMGLHFINQGLRQNEKCLMLGFYESPQRVVQKAAKVGIDLAGALENGNLEIIWKLPLEVLMDELALRVLDNIDRRGVTRLFIDGIDGFLHIAIHPERIKTFATALVNELRTRNVTTFFTQELPYFKESYARAESIQSILYENIMLLGYTEIDGINYRRFSVMKMREGDYDPAIQLMTISDAGIAIGGPISSLGKQVGRPMETAK
jgi:circadian clock protein KaiC